MSDRLERVQGYGMTGVLTDRQRADRDELYRQLEEQFMNLLRAAVRHYRGLDSEDDLWQVARWSFYQGAMQFDLQGKVFFEYYSKRKVYGALRTHTRKIGRVRDREQAVARGESGEELWESLQEQRIAISDDMLWGNLGSNSGNLDFEWQELLSERVLPRLERAVLLALYVWGYRQKEVAALLGLDRGTVGKYHRQALAKLRIQMTK